MKIKTYILKFYKVLALNRDYISYLGKPKMFALVLLAFITSLLNSLNYVALIPLASSIIDRREGVANEGALGAMQSFFPFLAHTSTFTLGAFIIVTFIIKFGLNVLFSHVAGLWGEGYLFQIRQRLIHSFSVNYYEQGNQSTSKVLHLNNITPKIGVFNWATFSLISKLIAGLFLFVSLTMVSFWFATYSIFFVIFWGGILLPVMKATRRFASEYTDSLRKVQSFMIDEIEAREIIGIYGLKKERLLRFRGLSEKIIRSNVVLSEIRAFVGTLQEFLIVVVGVVILCFANQWGLEVGYLVAFGYVFSKFIGTLNEASNHLNSALEVLPPTEEILNFIGSEPVSNDKSIPVDAPQIKTIAYHHLNFSWADQPLFKIEKLILNRGDRVLISGKNGEGKSTLLRVLSGLIKSEGALVVNQGIEASVSMIHAYYPRISYLPQKAVVFEGTLVENILLNSKKNVQDIENLASALHLNLDDYYPDWKNFMVRESGGNLSGGEIQLIGVFRALIREFDLMFMDEFANHLSQKIVSSIDEFLKKQNDKILVCISHTQVGFFNRELVLENGALREAK